jgi:hypothetical protein
MARNYHGYGENLERGVIGKSNVAKKKKRYRSQTGIKSVQD